jgi:putative spermidine/putrescine transport system substrate-binding protein/mannopine transport system substrate-binding protein
MSYSGRALSAMNDGAPFNVSWNDAVMDTGYFAILKDAPNPEGALKFINYFYGHAEGHPAFIKTANYATHSKEGVALLPEAEQKNYATSPDNYKLLLVPDFKWIGENRNMLRERWQNWLAE